MSITISKLTPADLAAVDKLMKSNSKTLGFLPREALLDYINKEGVLGAKTSDDQLVGYLLYAAYPSYFRITQLCVSEDFRNQGIAKRFIDKLKKSATTQKIIKLRCRRDFPAHGMWPELGFVPLYEKPGRSAAGHLLTHWYLILAPDDQLSLFQAKTSEETLDVVIDAQIFFDFHEPDNDKTKPSKALFHDFSIDSLKLWITDELFVEIDRGEDLNQRRIARQKVREFPEIEHNLKLTEHFEEVLRTLLPDNNQNQESDIRHLAKTAASDVDIFVTRDQALLKKAKKISDLTNIRVLSPTDLIIKLHELSEKQSYAMNRVSGSDLGWRRLTSTDFASFPFTSFLDHQERKGKFRENLELLLANPTDNECELLRSGDDIVAIRVLAKDSNDVLNVPLARVAHSSDRPLFGRFLIADTISKSVENKLDMVKFEASALTSSLIPDLLDMGFIKCNSSFIRFCFSRFLNKKEVMSEIARLSPESVNKYQDMSDIELERCCSPLGLETTDQKHFSIPIRPGYALSLIDRDQSANDLFGGNPNTLLRWDNVYYRAKTHHKMLEPPARILWYVSGTPKKIVAISHLDTVEIDTPKVLFRKFRKFGILKWKDLYKLCGGDPSKKIMALRFSHTFLFREPISLGELKNAFEEDNEDRAGLTLQSPCKVPVGIFRKLFRLGYPGQS